MTPNDESRKFWIVNDNLFVTPISDILEDIKRFIVISGEIVIIDFQKFTIGEFKLLKVFFSKKYEL